VKARDGVRVFVYDCCDPPFSTGGRTVLSDLIGRAGGVNVFADLDAGWSAVSWEQVLARRPQLIVVDDYASGAAGLRRKRAALERFAALAGLPVLVLPLGAVLGGVRSIDALEALRASVARVRGAG
jgi:iron complex transport system substrate-binding protein